MIDQAARLRQLVNNNEEEQQPIANVITEEKQHPVARVITVTSGKGGVGKSSLSVNLALQLQSAGKRVVILDADFGLANVEIMMGIRPKYTLADLMFKGKNLRDVVTEGPKGVGFISGGSGIQELSQLTREQIVYLTEKLVELDEIADVIIVDTGAGISDMVLEFLTSSTEILLVVTPEPTSITDAYALLKALNNKAEFCKEHTAIKMVANKATNEQDGRNLYEKMNAVIQKFLSIELEFLGTVPKDDLQSLAIIQQAPISISNPNAPSARGFATVAKKLNDTQEKEETGKKAGIAEWFSGLMRSRSKKH